MNEIELKPGEEICPNCEGTGVQEHCEMLIRGFRKSLTQVAVTCQRCWGEGKLDWIEMAMGKQLELVIFPFVADPDGSTDLYYAGTKVLETTSKGIRVKQ